MSEIVVLTGAGISVASGLPTYRGAGGLWTNSPEAMELANAESIEAGRLDELWKHFGPLRKQCQQAQPNAGHEALRRLEEAMGERFTLITQNVDGLHQRAGSKRVIELHGSIFSTRCSDASCESQPRRDTQNHTQAPPCSHCAKPERPGVVLFGEAIPAYEEHQCKRALRQCELFISIGTSGTVAPASGFARAADYAGARTISMTLEPMNPTNPYFGEEIIGRAEDELPALVKRLIAKS